MAVLPAGAGTPFNPVMLGGAMNPANSVPANREAFQEVIGQLLEGANNQQLQADQAIKDLVTGESQNVHEVMLALAKADLNLRTVLELRVRSIEADREIMGMQL